MRFASALFYSFLTSLYAGCFYFGISLLHTLATAGDIGSFFADFCVAMLVCFVFLSAVFYEVLGLFEELNKPRSEDSDKDNVDRSDLSDQGKNK